MSFLPDYDLAVYNHGGGRAAYSNRARFRQPQAIQRNTWDRSLRRLKQLERPEGRQHTRLVVMTVMRYPLSLHKVKDMLFERGIDLGHETIRLW